MKLVPLVLLLIFLVRTPKMKLLQGGLAIPQQKQHKLTPNCNGSTWDPIWPLFLGHTPLTGKSGHTDVYGFFSTTCRTKRVIYANDLKNMAIRANTAKYGSLSKKQHPYGARYELYVGNKIQALPSTCLGFFQMRPQDPKVFLDETLRFRVLEKTS